MDLRGFRGISKDVNRSKEESFLRREERRILNAVGDSLDPLLKSYTDSAKRTKVWKEFAPAYVAAYTELKTEFLGQLDPLWGQSITPADAAAWFDFVERRLAGISLKREGAGLEQARLVYQAHQLYSKGKVKEAEKLMPNIGRSYLKGGPSSRETLDLARQSYETKLQGFIVSLARPIATFFAVMTYGAIAHPAAQSLESVFTRNTKHERTLFSLFQNLTNSFKSAKIDCDALKGPSTRLIAIFEYEEKLATGSVKKVDEFLRAVCDLL